MRKDLNYFKVHRCLLDEHVACSVENDPQGNSSCVNSSTDACISPLKAQSFQKLRGMPTESRICLLSAVLAVVDVDLLASRWPHDSADETFITSVIAKSLLLLSDR